MPTGCLRGRSDQGRRHARIGMVGAPDQNGLHRGSLNRWRQISHCPANAFEAIHALLRAKREQHFQHVLDAIRQVSFCPRSVGPISVVSFVLHHFQQPDRHAVGIVVAGQQDWHDGGPSQQQHTLIPGQCGGWQGLQALLQDAPEQRFPALCRASRSSGFPYKPDISAG